MKNLMMAIAFFCTSCSPIYYTNPPVSSASAVPMGAPLGPMMVPLPPQNVGFLHGFPAQWETRRWALINYTKFFLRVRINGMEMVMQDNYVAVPHLPPGKTIHFAVSEYGETHFEADGFLPPDFAKPVVHCEWGKNVDPLNSGNWREVGIEPINCQ